MADEQPHLPPPSLWPVGLAIGVAVLLVGLVINPTTIAPVGAVIAIVFGFLWAREATSGVRRPVHVEPETREVASEPAPPAASGEAAMPYVGEAAAERFPRNKFLEGATLGVGGLIGGLVTVPATRLAIRPAVHHQRTPTIHLRAPRDLPPGHDLVAN